jgi:predicted DNA-binding transcriptional regulator YafY
MPDTTLRQITMLSLVPRRAPGISTDELRSALADRDFDVNLRTIQRDLNKLSAPFPLICTEGDPPRWSWAPHSEALTLPGHDPLSALSWQLIEQHLQPLLPRSLAREIEPHFKAARGFLETTHGGHFRRWSQRVRILPRAMQLQAPEIPEDVLDAVYQGLLEKGQIEVAYTSRDRDQPRQLTLHPLALVVRDSVHYLLATVWDFTDIRQLVLHRMNSARLLDHPSQEPQDFNLDEYIQQGGFDYASGQKIKLIARFEPYAAKALLETPLSPDQTHQTMDDDRIEFHATVNDSEQLRWWLMGYGSGVEVVAPKSLLQCLRQEAETLAARYRTEPPL